MSLKFLDWQHNECSDKSLKTLGNNNGHFSRFSKLKEYTMTLLTLSQVVTGDFGKQKLNETTAHSDFRLSVEYTECLLFVAVGTKCTVNHVCISCLALFSLTTVSHVEKCSLAGCPYVNILINKLLTESFSVCFVNKSQRQQEWTGRPANFTSLSACWKNI